MATMMTNAMHPPMIPHNAPSDKLDPRAAGSPGDSLVSSVVDSVDSVVGGVAAEQKLNH